MKNILGVSILAAVLIGCADSGQGTARPSESGRASSSTQIIATDPGVAAESGSAPVVSTGAVTETPARPSPLPGGSEVRPQQSNSGSESGAQGQLSPAEQGQKTSPEPRTGDDANPDSVNPRE